MPDTIPLKGQNCPAWRRNTVRHASGVLSAIIPESCPSWAGTRNVPLSAVSVQRLYVVGTHEARHSMLTAHFPGLSEIQKDARGAVDAMTGLERRADQAEQPSVFECSIRHRLG
jgi:hypothetical protein